MAESKSITPTEEKPFELGPPRSKAEERRAKKNARNREKWADPEYRAKKAAKMRARRANDPEFRARQNAYRREHRANDPGRKEELNARARERWANDPELRARDAERFRAMRADPESRAKLAAYQRKKKYGLEDHDYRAMLEACKHRCPICKVPFNDAIRKLKPAVDHCHKTGIVRGIICLACNQSLSDLLDNPKLLRAAARYLERTSPGNKAQS